MVGIVVVSHSKNLAEEIINFSMQMAKSEIKVINAGGTSDGRFGTDASKIVEAIQNVDDGSGVLILVDLGSAIMSAEMAVEFLDEELQKRVFIADAPIVEGSIAAISQASIGASLEEVKNAAEGAKAYSKK
ncbi:dihydroxyacetone kinase phosphoryl donor subunit DhaM [Tepidibacter formicigenes]|jgi:dihydroxyacetone kinase phosphotransfer subunit|uniref:phosphoenolpyruvate--glycerone phosphotransferase n=1 Tax=Tepidibacter formicigenes DSM 15518 TaxID=1123349 RepID=A0A1M6L548_9FIRM|nr:dihydroxyacetone kinase phosphoryl donor subunit DhaM [Tepidibacter formicigenes]SHJ66335.1 dihydroxyacetone kinase DhaM subunit [Tepidibacter formicigenes DSM 15518]